IPVTDHSYAEVILNAPTCEEEGIMRYTCSFCGDCYDAPIAATGHTLTKIRKEPTCTAIGSEQYLCELCGNLIGDMVILPKSDHTYGEWNASVEPTATKDGYGERTCSVCGANEMTTIPKFAQKCIVDGNMIYGIAAGLDIETFNNEYFVVSVATSQTTASSENKIGTGSYVTITDSNGTVISYDIFLFGDVNGDGWYDGMDAVTVSCIANGLLTKDQIGEAAYMAADCNHDGVVDEFDVAILNQAGVLLANVDQTKTHEELAVDSDYVEYLNLIDQNPTIEEEPEQTPEPQKTYESILEMIIDFIKTVFDFLISIFQK
ncbi:MAG: dockerin type I repeat-containing protein, partial [Acutalibacteraceae bacterium]